MRKSLKLLAVTAVLALCGLHSLSATPLDFKNSVGVYGLFNTPVVGIQYQRWCTDRIGFQTTGFVQYDQSDPVVNIQNDDGFSFSISGEFHLKLFETPFGTKSASVLYAWFLGGYHGFSDARYVEPEGEWDTPGYIAGYYEPTGFKSNAVLGIGFGFDIMFLNHLSIPIQFGFSGEFPNQTQAGFCFGTGVRYRF